MKRVVLSAALALLLAAHARGLHAQLSAPAAGGDIASVSVKLGLVSPQTTFSDASFGESSFKEGVTYGVTVAAWPALGRRLGIRGQLMRGKTEGENASSEFAPIAVNDPTIYFYTLELAVRHAMEAGSLGVVPSLSMGYGGKHYTWAVSQHRSSRFAAWTAAAGLDLRPASLGRFGITTELRGYRSNFRAFGIDDGSWEDGFYGGKVGGVKNLDVVLTTGVSLSF